MSVHVFWPYALMDSGSFLVSASGSVNAAVLEVLCPMRKLGTECQC